MEYIVAVEASALERVMKIAKGLCGRGAVSMPVLEHVWLRRESEVQRSLSSAGGDPEQRLVVSCTNTECGADLLVEAEFRVWPAGGEGMLLPIERSLAWLQTVARGEQVWIRTTGSTVELSSGGDQVELATLPTDDFPRPKMEETRTGWNVSLGVLATLAGGVMYALPARDHRRVLTGVFLELTAGGLCRMTATDGKKLCRVTSRDGEVMGPHVSGSVPPAFLEAIMHWNSSQMVISVGERQVRAVGDAGTIWSSTIEGKYPNVDAVIPKTPPRSVSIDARALERAVRRASVVSEDKTGSVILRQEGETLAVSAMSQDRGQSESIVRGVREIDGPILRFAVAADLLLMTLKALDAQRVILRQSTEAGPMLWEAEGPEGGADWVHLLMPVKLSEVAGAGAAGGEGE